MPGAVVTATVSVVIPFALFSKWSEQTQYKSINNTYANGESQSSALVGSTRRSWSLTQRLTSTQLALLKTFYGTQGCILPFYFYDVTVPGVVWDATGVATIGRYSVKFTSPWSDSVGLGRNDVPFELMQIS